MGHTVDPALAAPPVFFMFPFEESHDSLYVKRFLEDRWPLVFGSIAVYLVFIFAGPIVMKNRPRFELRTQLVLWNVALAIFSIAGFWRASPMILKRLFRGDIYNSVCDNTYFKTQITGVWCFYFTLSKLVELGDTVFIVLRKQRLIFLHWYHHITVLLFCWMGNSEFASTGLPFGCMNYAVHSMMYTYYALAAMKIKLPRVVALFITTAQLSQMVIGMVINLLAYWYKSAGRPCQISDVTLKIAFLMYFSYFVLFANYFYQTYFRTGGKRSAVKQKTEDVLSHAQILAKKAM